jgi:hypothetical protein
MKLHVVAGILIILFIVLIVITSTVILRRQQPADGHVSFVRNGAELMANVAPSYFAGFNQLDMCARKCDSREECAASYAAAVIPVNKPSDEMRIQRWCGEADALARAYHPGLEALAAMPWKICFIHDDAEGGFPHTHGSIIVLPTSFAAFAEEDDDVKKKKVTTLLHEKIHVFQRLHPAACHQLYRRFWALEDRVRIDTLPQAVRRRMRSNPDLDGYLYLDRTSGTCVQLYFPESGSDCTGLRLSASRPVLLRFTDSSSHDRNHDNGHDQSCDYEHPNEAMAYVMSEMIVAPPRQMQTMVATPDYRVKLTDGILKWLDWLAAVDLRH